MNNLWRNIVLIVKDDIRSFCAPWIAFYDALKKELNRPPPPWLDD